MKRRLPSPDEKIFAGLVGDVVNVSAPFTEADPVAIATQFLVGFGNAVGRGPHFYVGDTKHHMNEFLAIVGTSSRSRKGDSKNAALRALKDADPAWAGNISSGLSSAEGLISAVGDGSTTTPCAGRSMAPNSLTPGIADKRLLVVESEFSGALKQFERSGNTLSPLLRDAWDGSEVLRTMTKHSPTRATNAHISLIAHTTPEDLHAHLSATDSANGFGNRFIFLLAERSKLLAVPGRASEEATSALTRRVGDVLTKARRIGEIQMTPAAETLWKEIYPDLTSEIPGLVGKLTARAEAHVRRLSALYALVAQSAVIDVDHLESALALWEYSEQCVRMIFGDHTGNSDAERIKRGMHPGRSLTLTELRDQIFDNHITKPRLDCVLDLLVAAGDIELRREPTGGRPVAIITRLDSSSSDAAPDAGASGQKEAWSQDPKAEAV